MGAQNLWSDEEIATLRKMSREGRTLKEISQAIGRSTDACRRVAYAHNVAITIPPRTKFTPEHREKLMAMRRLGIGFRAISDELGFSKTFLETAANHMASGKSIPAMSNRECCIRFTVALMKEAAEVLGVYDRRPCVGDLKKVVARSELDIIGEDTVHRVYHIHHANAYSCVGSVAASCADG